MNDDGKLASDVETALADRLRLDDRPGPAVRISSKRANAMLDAALDAWSPSPTRVVEESSASMSRRPRWRFGMWVAAAVFVLVGAAAAYWVARERGWMNAPSSTDDTAAAGGASTPRRDVEAAGGASTPRREAAAGEEQARGDLDLHDGQPAGPTAPVMVPTPSSSREPARSVGAGARTEPPRDARAEASPSSPEDLLREANRLRGSRRWREAERTYTRVMREHPSTMSAHVARVAAADIRLSQLGDPRGALRLYRGALGGRGSGALALEARQGIAESLRRMGNTVEETRALRAIVASHPGTPAARRAARRLAEIESTP